MEEYKKLNKELKTIRWNRRYDLYETHLKSQKLIDEFYKGDLSENVLMSRKFELEMRLERRNLLLFPVLITVVFGILITVVCNFLFENPSLFEIPAMLSNIPTIPENTILIAELRALIFFLYFIFFLYILIIFFMFYIPISAINGFGKSKVAQTEYEIKVLNMILDEKFRENKNGKKYISKKKRRNEYCKV